VSGSDPDGDRDDDPDAEDRRLMGLVARGDRAAFEALYERHGATVMRFLHHLSRDPGLAEDLTQEVFVRAWRAAPRWRPTAKVRTWLLRIAERRGWTEGAKRSRRARVWGAPGPRRGPEPSAPLRDPVADLERAEEVAALRDAVAALSPRLRVAFVLVRLQGLSFADAAEVADVPVGTVKSRMAAAEAFLRERLSHRKAP
jgi:RNA polymerase sigma-70 factor (ECF subfamily)